MAESLSASEGIVVLSKLSGAFTAYFVYRNEDATIPQLPSVGILSRSDAGTSLAPAMRG